MKSRFIQIILVRIETLTLNRIETSGNVTLITQRIFYVLHSAARRGSLSREMKVFGY